MNKELYLKKLSQSLNTLPKSEREDVLKEIEQNIDEAISLGENESTVLSRLGDPTLLAKAYNGDYYVKNNKVLKSIPFFFLTSFFSIIIVPTLTFFTVSFGIGAIGAIILGILRTFGVQGIPMKWNGQEASRAISMLLAVPCSLIFGLISLGTWKMLKSYFSAVSKGYKKRIKLNG